MTRRIRVLSFLLSLTLLLSFVSCGKEEEKETGELSETQISAADKEAVAAFIKKYRAGEYQDKQRFLYDDLSAYYQLGEYKGISYPDDPQLNTEVTDAQVEDYLTGIQVVGMVSDEEYTALTEGVVQKFDVVTMDYTGYIDGVVDEKATATDQELLIGSGKFIDGFEEGLVGAPIGREVTLNLRFSIYYADPSVAGKDIEFRVLVKKVNRPAIPELTVEEINKLYGSGFKTLEEVREDIRSYLKNQNESLAYSCIAEYVQGKVAENGKVISYPEKEVEYYQAQFISYYMNQLEDGQTIEDYCQKELGIDYEQFRKDARTYGEETVGAMLLLKLIAQKEGIKATDEQLEALILQLYQEESSYYGSVESLIQDYISLYGPDYFEEEVQSALVIQFLVDQAVKMK